MLSMSEWHVVDRSVHKLVLHALALAGPHAREPEAIERVSTGVDRVIAVGGVRGSAYERARRNESAVGKGDVLENLAVERDCTRG